MAEHLMDDEGENRAVRAFLMQYGTSGLTVGAMRLHMERCGFPEWPHWVKQQDGAHLTKAGAQLWLRHLFALEQPRCATCGSSGRITRASGARGFLGGTVDEPCPTCAAAGNTLVSQDQKAVSLSALAKLAGLIDPEPVEVNGKRMVFKNPMAQEVLTRVSAEVRKLIDYRPEGEKR